MTIALLNAAQRNTVAVPPAFALPSVDMPNVTRRALRRVLLHHSELIAVLALLGSSAAAGASLLLNLGP